VLFEVTLWGYAALLYKAMSLCNQLFPCKLQPDLRRKCSRELVDAPVQNTNHLAMLHGNGKQQALPALAFNRSSQRMKAAGFVSSRSTALPD
jgi:hypothetical protein